MFIALRGLGHDVLTSRDAGKSNEAIPDEEVLCFAIENQRAVITHNRQDFIRLHRQNSPPILRASSHGCVSSSQKRKRNGEQSSTESIGIRPPAREWTLSRRLDSFLEDLAAVQILGCIIKRSREFAA